MSAALISPAWRRRALAVWIIALLGFTLLAVLVAGDHSTAFDDWLFRELYEHTGNGFAQATLGLSEPVVSISICAVVAVRAALVRRWDVVALVSLGPGGTVLLAKFVFKPLLGRAFAASDIYQALLGHPPPFDNFTLTGVFPSGHESAVASTACVLVILCSRATLSRRVRSVLFTVIGVWTLVAAVGLVRNFWHYPTDTLGAICLSVVVVVGLAFLLDRYFAGVQLWVANRLGARGQLTRRS